MASQRDWRSPLGRQLDRSADDFPPEARSTRSRGAMAAAVTATDVRGPRRGAGVRSGRTPTLHGLRLTVRTLRAHGIKRQRDRGGVTRPLNVP